ncbi:MAG TPA: hypothetical protein VG994_02715 [Steroidobacteraceae bacterium]|nr:hypothetical protein [Steroidobacteraceae bacterium]
MSARYTPIDVRLSEMPTRILRGLRRTGWIQVDDFRDLVLDLPPNGLRQHPERNAFSAALIRLVRAGLVEKRAAYTIAGRLGVHTYDVRLTDRGRAELARRLAPDTATEFAPARPGTEHYL